MPRGRGPITFAEAERLERDGPPEPGRMVAPMSKAELEAWDRRLKNRVYVAPVVVWREGDVWVRHGPGSMLTRGGAAARWGRWVTTYSARPPEPGERMIDQSRSSSRAR